MNKILTSEKDVALMRRPAKRVKNPQSTDVILAIQSMKRSLLAWENFYGRRAEGLAAPQIGIPMRLVILRNTDDVPPRDPNHVLRSEDVCRTEHEYLAACEKRKAWVKRYGSMYDPFHVLINPRILIEEGSQESVEGCLSLPGQTYKVIRPSYIGFDFVYPNGKRSAKLSVKDHSAAVLKHEIDHLDGILLPDVASEKCIGEEVHVV